MVVSEGQFFRLYDRGGKEVYEGDITSFKGLSDEYVKVSWDSKNLSFYLNNDFFNDIYSLSSFEKEELLVIGNF